MITLCTGIPDVAINGDRILISIPSGKSTIEIAIDPHHGLHLKHGLHRRVDEVLRTSALAGTAAIEAEVVPITRRRRRKP